LLGYILEIEDIFYETEPESDEYGKQNSLLHGIDKRK